MEAIAELLDATLAEAAALVLNGAEVSVADFFSDSADSARVAVHSAAEIANVRTL